MPFLDTTPADIDGADPGSGWARLRVDDERRVLLCLHTLSRGDAPVTIGLADGPTFPASLWSVDGSRRVLHFRMTDGTVIDARLRRASKLWGVGYDGGAKLQFELRQVAIEDLSQQRLLHAALPSSLYRMPRREALRVRPTAASAPTVRMRHPLAPARWMRLRAIDIGADGCALWRPFDALPLPPGMVLLRSEIQIDEQTFFHADLTVQNVSTSNPAAGHLPGVPGVPAVPAVPAVPVVPGMRVGCRWDGLAPPARAALLKWLRGGQGRRERLSLSFEDSKV